MVRPEFSDRRGSHLFTLERTAKLVSKATKYEALATVSCARGLALIAFDELKADVCVCVLFRYTLSVLSTFSIRKSGTSLFTIKFDPKSKGQDSCRAFLRQLDCFSRGKKARTRPPWYRLSSAEQLVCRPFFHLDTPMVATFIQHNSKISKEIVFEQDPQSTVGPLAVRLCSEGNDQLLAAASESLAAQAKAPAENSSKKTSSSWRLVI